MQTAGNAERLEEQVELILAFNRLYGQRMGVLGQQTDNGPFSLTEMRVIYEIYRARSTTARDLCQALDLDAGYLSRILQRLETQKIVDKKPSREDARRRQLTLTQKGKKVYLDWIEKTNARVRGLLGSIGDEEKAQLLTSLKSVSALLENIGKTKGAADIHWTGDNPMTCGVVRHGNVAGTIKTARPLPKISSGSN